jgi:S1-C subfamily serine protease
MKRMILWAVVAAVSVSAAWADGLADQGRQVLGKNQNAVVAIRVVLKVGMSMGGQTAPKRDQKIETTGVVIDPSGLIVASYATVDPTEQVKSALSSRGGRPEDMNIETEITDLKIVLADQSEIAGQVVLRDADLDLAFIRPNEKPAKPFVAVDLTQNAKLQILDEVVVMNRLGKVGNRATVVSLGRIEAVLTKPRTFYVLGQTTWGYSLGAPVFALDGKVAGLVLLRNTKADLDTTRGFLFDNLSKFGMMPVILPAEDVHEAAKSAPATAAPPTAKPAE